MSGSALSNEAWGRVLLIRWADESWKMGTFTTAATGCEAGEGRQLR